MSAKIINHTNQPANKMKYEIKIKRPTNGNPILVINGHRAGEIIRDLEKCEWWFRDTNRVRHDTHQPWLSDVVDWAAANPTIVAPVATNNNISKVAIRFKTLSGIDDKMAEVEIGSDGETVDTEDIVKAIHDLNIDVWYAGDSIVIEAIPE